MGMPAAMRPTTGIRWISSSECISISIEEIDERIQVLREEITRLEQMRAEKQASKSAADAVFKA
ncbi:MAG: DUF1192 family protein [Bradymonadaceae bacterium]